MDKLIICYHGTHNKNIADKILKEGFLPMTWFAKHLENAILYGGKYVFEVCFLEKHIDKLGWQFRIQNNIKPDKIVSLTKYINTNLKENKKLRDKIFKSNI